jgi:hypothetical protein
MKTSVMWPRNTGQRESYSKKKGITAKHAKYAKGGLHAILFRVVANGRGVVAGFCVGWSGGELGLERLEVLLAQWLPKPATS